MIGPEKDQPKANLLEKYWGRMTPEQKALFIAGAAALVAALVCHFQANQHFEVADTLTQLSHSTVEHLKNSTYEYYAGWNQAIGAVVNNVIHPEVYKEQLLGVRAQDLGNKFAVLGSLLAGISEISAAVDSRRRSPAPATNSSV